MANWFTAQQIAEVLDQHAAALELFAAQWTDQPEDCVQEAILELMRQPERPRNIAAWLFFVIKRRAISANRAATRRRRHESLAARLFRVTSESNETPFDAEELAAALGLLDDQSREMVIARVWGGLGFAELGELQGISAATAFRRFESSLQSLREKLEASCQTTHRPAPPAIHPNYPTT